MRFETYINVEKQERLKWLEGFQMEVGLRYFGGKAKSGRYIMNNIFNLAGYMNMYGEKADILIDAYTGGGKIGLSVPDDSWFETIVLNDVDYGIYSFYMQCKNNPDALLKMILAMGDAMSREMFHKLASSRDRSICIGHELTAAAMTFWVTMASRDGMTAPDRANYRLTRKDARTKKDDREIEHEAIEEIKQTAQKRIPALYAKLNSMNYVIENLEFKELLKKYNGKAYDDPDGNEYQAVAGLGEKNKLWYFDPPYFPPTLSGGKDAPYLYSSSIADTLETTTILHGDYEDTYGEVKYFIKSDYDPKEFLDENDKYYHAFDKLEESPFCKILLGEFEKGAIDDEFKKTIGKEFIWCRGFPDNYETISI